MKRGSPNSGFAGMTPEAKRAAQSKGGKAAQAKRVNPRKRAGFVPNMKLRSVGFWHDSPFSTFPNPHELVDLKWNTEERKRVVEYLRAGERYMGWMGYSYCRFECGVSDSAMGCLDLTDGAYVWPEGFAHYVEKHGVRPPQKFIDHVLSKRQR